MFDPKAQEWFWNIYRGLKKQGVAGWWGDLGEPEVHPDDIQHPIGSGDAVHNAYGHRGRRWCMRTRSNDTPERTSVQS